MSVTECKSESPGEALERFEKALMDYQHALTIHRLDFDTEDDLPNLKAKMETAKEELLTWLSYIP